MVLVKNETEELVIVKRDQRRWMLNERRVEAANEGRERRKVENGRNWGGGDG